LNETFAAMTAPKCIVTTEKDAARLTQVDGLSDEVIRNLYALPVRISFMLDQEEVFNNLITGYVIKNSRTHIVAQQKDDNKPKDEKAEADDKPKKIVFRKHKKQNYGNSKNRRVRSH
jgi:tetraacyldisaccharide 4'-kinase